MNYTENYHLPQWKKEDRVMMEDFNRMCADIEAGLSAERAGLLRAAYNHYQLAAAAGTLPAQDGMFIQKLGGEKLPGNVSNMVSLSDCCWIARGSSTLSNDNFKSYFTVEQAMKLVKGDLDACAPMIATFTPPVPGQLTKIALRGGYKDCDTKSASIRLRFINLSTGECEVDELCQVPFSSGNISLSEPPFNNISLRFHGGIRYRLELIPEDATLNATFQLLGSQKGTTYAMTAAGTITQTLTDPDGAADGIALVSYGTYGQGGTLTLSWDGETVKPYRSRTFTDEKGRSVTETVYWKSGGVPKNSVLKLTATCPAGGELCLYEWGAVLA